MAKNLNIGNSSSPVHVNINEKLMIKSNVVPAISGSAMTMGSTTVPTYVSDGLIVEASDKFAFWKDISDSTTGVSVDDYLLRTGGTMIGPLALSADPTAAMQATTKNYVDSNFALKTGTNAIGTWPINISGNADTVDGYHHDTFVKRAGDTMTGSLTNNSNGGSWISGRERAIIRNTTCTEPPGSSWHVIASSKTPDGSFEIGTLSGYNELRFVYTTDDNYSADNNTALTCGYFSSSGVFYGACWNDYAEYRESNVLIPGKCIVENGNDTLSLSIERLQPGASIISDTFGFAIGETEKCKTPIAVSGRVLAYPFEDREEFKKNIGRPVCSGPNGTVSIMTDEEYKEKGYCAIGTISAVPDYEEWGTGNVKIDGRVWIKVR